MNSKLWLERLKLREDGKLPSFVTLLASSRSPMRRLTNSLVRDARIYKPEHICSLMITMLLGQRLIISQNYWRPPKSPRLWACIVDFQILSLETETSHYSQVNWWTSRLQLGSNTKDRNQDPSKRRIGWETNQLRDTTLRKSTWIREKKSYTGAKMSQSGAFHLTSSEKPLTTSTTRKGHSSWCYQM